MYELILTPISVLLGAIGTYVIIKRSMSTENLTNKVTEIIDYLAKDKEVLQNVYGIGYAIGAGAISGSGFKGAGKSLGKNGLVEMILGRILGGIIPQQEQQPQGATPFGQAST